MSASSVDYLSNVLNGQGNDDSGDRGHAPLVTVSLVTYNGMHWLPGCLASLERQTLRDFELLVLDNASTDGSLDWLRERAAHLPRMSVESSATNLGFAAGQNLNIYRARGEFVCLLNQDVELDEQFLERALAGFAGGARVAAVQGKLLRLLPDGTRSDVIDSTGLDMHRSRRVVSRGQGRSDSQRWAVAGPVWGVDGPAPVYRKQALVDVEEPRTAGGHEILDEDFFMYKEDVDLAWRLRRSGWRSWYQPSAVAWHGRTAGAGEASSLLDVARTNWTIAPWIKAQSWRNQRLMQLKNEDAGAALPDIPWILARELASAAFVLAFDRQRLRALGPIRRSIQAALAKRPRHD
jgi:GT2 family glycosyltransferase